MNGDRGGKGGRGGGGEEKMRERDEKSVRTNMKKNEREEYVEQGRWMIDSSCAWSDNIFTCPAEHCFRNVEKTRQQQQQQQET